MYQIVTFLSAREPQKLKMVGNTWFFYELGPFLVFIPCLTEKIGEFQLVTSKFSAFSGVKRNGSYIFQLFRCVKSIRLFHFSAVQYVKSNDHYIFQLFSLLKVT